VEVPFGKCLLGEDAGLTESNGSLPPGDDLKKSPVGSLPVHRDQLRAQRLVKSMGELTFYLYCYYKYATLLTLLSLFSFSRAVVNMTRFISC